MSAESPTRSRKSATRRDFPIPAGPSSVTSRHELVVEDVLEVAPETVALALPSDEKRLGVAREPLRLGENLEQGERVDGLRFPFENERLDRLDSDGVADEAVRLGSDEHLACAGRLLEPRSDVDGVAGDERLAFTADDDLAGVDPDARLEPVLGDGGAHLGGGANGAQRVVLVRDGDPEDGHDGVADELLDGAAVALEDRREDPRSSGASARAAPRDRSTRRAPSSRRGRRRGR